MIKNNVREIEERNINKVHFSKGLFSFEFFDVYFRKVKVDGKVCPLNSGEMNKKNYFIGTFIPRNVLETDEEYNTPYIRKNLLLGDLCGVCETLDGRFIPVRDKNKVISPDDLNYLQTNDLGYTY